VFPAQQAPAFQLFPTPCGHTVTNPVSLPIEAASDIRQIEPAVCVHPWKTMNIPVAFPTGLLTVNERDRRPCVMECDDVPTGIDCADAAAAVAHISASSFIMAVAGGEEGGGQ
jgi:hypothetical protein